MSQQFRRAPMPKPKMIFDERKLNLTAPPIQKGGRPASLAINLYRNNVQLTVFPNADNGSGVNIISGGSDLHTFRVICQAIRFLADPNTPPDQFEIDNNVEIPKEERTDPKVRMRVKTRTRVGKNDDGILYIAVIDNNQNAPKVQFKFGLSYWHKIRRRSGDMDQAQLSAWCAIEWANMAVALVENTLANAAMGLGENHPPKDSGGGGNGGGYGGNKGNYGGGNKGGYGGNGGGYGGGNSGGGYNKPKAQSNEMEFDDGDFGD